MKPDVEIYDTTLRDGAQAEGINFSALDIAPDFRLKNAWFDYQFIGLNKIANVVGRSPIFSERVTFTLDCP